MMSMKLRRADKSSQALTLIEVLVVIFAAAAMLLLWLLLQPVSHAKGKAVRINCASNLKQIAMAFRTWESDNSNHYPMHGFTNELGKMEFPNASNMFRYFQVMSNGLINPKILICPADSRSAAANFNELSNTNLSYFIGLDAADESDTNMLLTGDRNLVVDGVAVGAGLLTLNATNPVGWSATMHNFGGNVGLADGSVQQLTSSGLQAAIAHSGTNVNRLAVP
jgi:prepilin-type processing-associated H-X9-DG protein